MDIRSSPHSSFSFPKAALFVLGVFRSLLGSVWLPPRWGPGGSGSCPISCTAPPAPPHICQAGGGWCRSQLWSLTPWGTEPLGGHKQGTDGLCSLERQDVFPSQVWDSLTTAGTATDCRLSHFALPVQCIYLCTVPGLSEWWWRIRDLLQVLRCPRLQGQLTNSTFLLFEQPFILKMRHCSVSRFSTQSWLWVNLKRQREI